MRLFGLLIFMIINLLFANTLSAHLFSGIFKRTSCFDGFYLGAAGGTSQLNVATKANGAEKISLTFQSFDLQSLIDQENCKLSPLIEVYLGFGKQCANLYLGSKFGANYSCNEVVSRCGFIADVSAPFILPFDTVIKYKLRAIEYYVDFKTGIVLCCDTMLFGIVGAAFNEKSVSTDIRASGFLDEDTATFNFPIEVMNKKRETTTGLRVGFGFERMLCNRCLSLHANYVYTNYWSLSAQTSSESLENNLITSSLQVKPRKQIVTLGLSYYF